MPFPSGRVTGSRVHLNMGLTDVGLSTTGSACGRMRWPLASCGLPGQCRSDFRFEANAAAPDGRSWGDLDPAAGRFVRRTPNRTQPVVGRSDLGPTSVPPRALDAHRWPLRRGRDRQQARTAANGKALDQRVSVKCRLERFCAVSLDGEFDYRRVASPEEVSMCARQGCGHSALVELPRTRPRPRGQSPSPPSATPSHIPSVPAADMHLAQYCFPRQAGACRADPLLQGRLREVTGVGWSRVPQADPQTAQPGRPAGATLTCRNPAKLCPPDGIVTVFARARLRS